MAWSGGRLALMAAVVWAAALAPAATALSAEDILLSSPVQFFEGIGLDLLSPVLRFLEVITRFFREHNHYEEGHVHSELAPLAAGKEYDFVVVGAGTAGSVLANRLTEEGDWSVLLLEAGRDENALTDVPVLSAVWQSTVFNWGYKTQGQDDACLAMGDNRCSWPRGKVIGGTSVINYMVHCRGDRRDYDNWAAAGNEGWGFDDVLPYFIKSEKVEIEEYADSPSRGHEGYLSVERAPYHTPLSDAFVAAGEELGFPKVDYVGDGPTGFSLIQATMRNGSRCSANKAYLRPVRDRSNLHILSRAKVTRVVIDPTTKRATGVEFESGHLTWTVRARKEVVLSAGVLNSPQLLMLSGVGPKEHLEDLGIPVLKDLRVGYNLMEHYGYLGTTFLVNDSVSIRTNRVLEHPQTIAEYFFRGEGPLTVAGGAEALGYIRTPYAEDARHDVELLFVGATLAADDGTAVPLGLNMQRSFYSDYFGSLWKRDGFTIWPLVMHPRSRGRVSLRSKDPSDAPLFDANFFSDPRDMDVLIEGIKMAVRVAQTEAFKRFDAQLYAKPVPGCEAVPQGSDAYWACAARRLTAVLHHQVGTCKMGPASDPDAVVDPQLRVHGVEGLRVADTSVMPVVPTGHTATPTYMVGEKAADLVKQAWGRAGSSSTKQKSQPKKDGEETKGETQR